MGVSSSLLYDRGENANECVRVGCVARTEDGGLKRGMKRGWEAQRKHGCAKELRFLAKGALWC
jgi:hypothetical protein